VFLAVFFVPTLVGSIYLLVRDSAFLQWQVKGLRAPAERARLVAGSDGAVARNAPASRARVRIPLGCVVE
jgi:hypothetical protein